MVVSSSSFIESHPPTLPEELRIRNWPLRDEWIVTWPILIFAAVLAAGVGWAADDRFFGVGAFALLFAAQWRLWIPVDFEIGSRGVEQVCLGRRRRIPWSAIQSYRLRNHGALLCATSESAPVSRLQGVYLRFGEHREAVVACLEYYLSQQRESLRQ